MNIRSIAEFRRLAQARLPRPFSILLMMGRKAKAGKFDASVLKFAPWFSDAFGLSQGCKSIGACNLHFTADPLAKKG